MTRARIPALFVVVTLLAAVAFAEDQPNRVQLRDWKIQSACQVKAGGEKISAPDFEVTGWHSAAVPSTVVGVLVADHTFPDPYFGANITTLPGYVAKYDFANFDMPTDSPYRCSWWYRTEFTTASTGQGTTRW